MTEAVGDETGGLKSSVRMVVCACVSLAPWPGRSPPLTLRQLGLAPALPCHPEFDKLKKMDGQSRMCVYYCANDN